MPSKFNHKHYIKMKTLRCSCFFQMYVGTIGKLHFLPKIWTNQQHSSLFYIYTLFNLCRVKSNTNPVSPNWQWICCVHVPLPIVARLSVSKDLHLEVPHHGVHHLPRTQEKQDGEMQTQVIGDTVLIGQSLVRITVDQHLRHVLFKLCCWFTCWPSEAVSQVWCRYHSDRHQSWESEPGSGWQGAGWVSPLYQGRDAVEAETET